MTILKIRIKKIFIINIEIKIVIAKTKVKL